jgi:hypothetical protein
LLLSLLEEKVFGLQIFIFKVFVKEPCCYHSFFITSYISRIQCNLKEIEVKRVTFFKLVNTNCDPCPFHI